MKKKSLGQCRQPGVTEEQEKAFGSMQAAWSDRRVYRKSIWVNADSLKGPKSMKKKHLGQCRQPGVTEEHEKKAFGSMQAAWSVRRV
jgi:hypothetical protein